jgi:hypothetical protein
VGVEDDGIQCEEAVCLRRVGENEANPDFTQFVSIFTAQTTGLID